MVVGNFVCPYCNTVERIVLDQTKSGACNFTDYGLGECAPGFYEDSIDKGSHSCRNCKTEYDYVVTFSSGVMTSIKIKDKIFNKSYTYHEEKECVPKVYSEEDLQEMSNQLKWMKQVLDFNYKRIEQSQNIVGDIHPKIELLKSKISSQVNQKYGL